MGEGGRELARRPCRPTAAKPARVAQRPLTRVDGALATELERLDPDPELRCAVIAGSDAVFAAGADIRAMSERSFAEVSITLRRSSGSASQG